jgi:hypothetical protein
MPDARTVTQNTGIGGTITVPIASDGKTDTWSYTNNNGSLIYSYDTPSNAAAARRQHCLPCTYDRPRS